MESGVLRTSAIHLLIPRVSYQCLVVSLTVEDTKLPHPRRDVSLCNASKLCASLSGETRVASLGGSDTVTTHHGSNIMVRHTPSILQARYLTVPSVSVWHRVDFGGTCGIVVRAVVRLRSPPLEWKGHHHLCHISALVDHGSRAPYCNQGCVLIQVGSRDYN